MSQLLQDLNYACGLSMCSLQSVRITVPTVMETLTIQLHGIMASAEYVCNVDSR